MAFAEYGTVSPTIMVSKAGDTEIDVTTAAVTVTVMVIYPYET